MTFVDDSDYKMDKSRKGKEIFSEYKSKGQVEAKLIDGSLNFSYSFDDKGGSGLIAIAYQNEELTIKNVLGYDIKFIQSWRVNDEISNPETESSYGELPRKYAPVHDELDSDNLSLFYDIYNRLLLGVPLKGLHIDEYDDVIVTPTPGSIYAPKK